MGCFFRSFLMPFCVCARMIPFVTFLVFGRFFLTNEKAKKNPHLWGLGGVWPSQISFEV
jgi:hypothetical protein